MLSLVSLLSLLSMLSAFNLLFAFYDFYAFNPRVLGEDARAAFQIGDSVRLRDVDRLHFGRVQETSDGISARHG